MKRLLFTLAALAVGSGLSAQSSTLVGTKHNLSSTGTGGHTNSSQICVYCHTPHSAIGSVSNDNGQGGIAAQIIPLWNHTTTASAFTMYNNTNVPVADLQGTVDASPSGASLACLSCHDGSLAIGAVYNVPNDVASITYTAGGGVNASGIIASGPARLSADLSNDHPISITYNAGAGGDPGLVAAASLTGVKLYSNKVQCASCHDVHSAAVAAPLLRVTMAGSALCVRCHIK